MAMNCEVVLLPGYLTAANRAQLAKDYQLSAMVDDFDLQAGEGPEELSLSWDDAHLVILTSGSGEVPRGWSIPGETRGTLPRDSKSIFLWINFPGPSPCPSPTWRDSWVF